MMNTSDYEVVDPLVGHSIDLAATRVLSGAQTFQSEVGNGQREIVIADAEVPTVRVTVVHACITGEDRLLAVTEVMNLCTHVLKFTMTLTL